MVQLIDQRKTILMTHSINKIFFSSLLCILFLFDLPAQIVVLQYRAVPQENIADFVFRETTYWSQVANKAIKDGKMVKWELWQRVGGYELDEDEHNFVFVNVYEDKYDLDEDIWDVTMVFPNIRVSDMETTTMGRTVHQMVLEQHLQAGFDQGQYAKFNYAKVNDMDSFMDFESNTWYPFINDAIRNGETSFIGWGLFTVLTPTGSQIPFDAITIDHFDSYSEAVIPRMTEDVDELLDIPSSLAARDRIMAQIYQLVGSATK